MIFFPEDVVKKLYNLIIFENHSNSLSSTLSLRAWTLKRSGVAIYF